MTLDLQLLHQQPIAALIREARALGVDNAAGLRRAEMVFEIGRRRSRDGVATGEGVLETLSDGFGFLRSPESHYMPGPADIYVSPSQIRLFNLRTGDRVRGRVRPPKDNERYFAMRMIESINRRAPEVERDKTSINNLTPVLPTRELSLLGGPLLSALQHWAPLAAGQRVAIKGPDRSGCTNLLIEVVQASLVASLDVFVVLLDERPERVTTVCREIPEASVVASFRDESAERPVQLAAMARERARRLVEQGRDVLLVVDSLSRLARAADAAASSGPRPPGAVDPAAARRLRQFFGAGRCLEEGGSLTILGSLLTGTSIAADRAAIEAISEASNVELQLGVSAAGSNLPTLCPAESFIRGPVEYLDGTRQEVLRRLHARFAPEERVDPAEIVAYLGEGPSGSGVLRSVDPPALERKDLTA